MAQRDLFFSKNQKAEQARCNPMICCPPPSEERLMLTSQRLRDEARMSTLAGSSDPEANQTGSAQDESRAGPKNPPP
jgi:hypothetical protein